MRVEPCLALHDQQPRYRNRLVHGRRAGDELLEVDRPVRDGVVDAWKAVRDIELHPMRDGEKCPVRRIIGGAAPLPLGVGAEKVAEWRSRLGAEPTFTNKRHLQAAQACAPIAFSRRRVSAWRNSSSSWVMIRACIVQFRIG